MDDDSNNNLPYGALSLRSQNINAEVMVWDEDGNVGINTTTPGFKLHVNGDAKVSNTLYTNTVDATGVISAGNIDVTDDAMIGDTLFAGAFEANAIGKENISDEVGIASAASTDFYDMPMTWASYLSREITVPTAGYILATGFARLIIEHDVSGLTSASIAFSDLPDNTNGAISSTFFFGSSADAGNYTMTAPVQRLFYVPSGGTYTYYMLGNGEDDGDVGISGRQMDLLFIPTVYSSKDGGITGAEDNIFSAHDTEADRINPIDAPPKSGARTISLDALESKLTRLLTEVQEVKREMDILKNQ
jgi:hypothetical protein